MFYFKLTLTGLLVVSIYGLATCENENITNNQLPLKEDKALANGTLPEEMAKTMNSSRSGRTLVPHSRTPAFTLRHRQPIQIRARADHLPLRTQIRRAHNGPPNGHPQPQNIRLGFESLKSSKFMPYTKTANLPLPNNGKGSSKRPQLLAGHPNAIHVPALSQQYMHNFKASPVFNGQVKVHAVGQTQKQQTASPPKDNAYPKYVKSQQPPAAAAVSPPQTQPLHQLHYQRQPHQQKPSPTKYLDFKQYPIPDQEKMQQHNEQHEKYLHQQKFLTPKNPIAYYQLQHTQQHQELPAPQPHQNYPVQQPLPYLPQQHHHHTKHQQQQQQQQQQQPTIPIHESVQTHNNINNLGFPSAASVPPKMYSVYEDNDVPELQTNNYQTAAYQAPDNDAQEYLRFMNSDEYFLPKKEPNYKRLDEEADKRQFGVLKAQVQQHLHAIQQSPAATPYHQSLPQQQKTYLPQVYAPAVGAPQAPQYPNSQYSDDAADTTIYNQDKGISRLFYEPNPSAPASASAAATVVRTSYQTGYNQNQFVVNSQDSKIGKYTVPPSSATSSVALPTQPPIAYPQLRHNTAPNRTPEPLRFEFTERDAMVGSYSSYTNAPQAQIRYKELLSHNATPNAPHRVESSTQNYLNRNLQTTKPIEEDGEDDPEEGDDITQIANGLFGRQPGIGSDLKVNTVTSTTEGPPSEQHDTEDYCERICAIVDDENEEIVCGSDGYMYTSEAQMECYASCLHIDVTIQGKGSCSAR